LEEEEESCPLNRRKMAKLGVSEVFRKNKKGGVIIT
jgi:hypothetical protein